MDKYLWITYLSDGELEWTDIALLQWSEKNCPKGKHLYDEVLSLDKHYLHCDACGKTVDINPDGTPKT